MNSGEFIKKVLIAGREIKDQEYLHRRLEEYLDIEGNRDFFQNDVSKFISGISCKKISSSAKPNIQSDKPTSEEELSPEEARIARSNSPLKVIGGMEWQRAIKHDVEKIRMELFGIKGAPFYNDLRTAEIWIKSKADDPCLEFFNEYTKLDTMLYKKNHLFQKKYGLPLPFTKSQIFLEYKNEFGKVELASSWANVDLYKLCSWAMIFSECTGFAESEITSHVLTGLPLINQSVCITRIKKSRVDFSSAIALLEEIKTLHDQLRAESLLNRFHVLNEEELWLYELVEAKGGAPAVGKQGMKNGTIKFWEEIRENHNEKYPRFWRSWGAAKKRYELILKRLNIN